MKHALYSVVGNGRGDLEGHSWCLGSIQAASSDEAAKEAANAWLPGYNLQFDTTVYRHGRLSHNRYFAILGEAAIVLRVYQLS